MEGNAWDGGMGIFGIIALLAIANGGFGGFGGARGVATDGSLIANDALVSNALQTATLEASANARQMCADFANTNSNVVNGNYQTQNMVNGGFANLTRDIGTASTGIVQSIRNNADSIEAKLGAMGQAQVEGFFATQNAINNMGQKILDNMAQNKIEALQAQINQLQMQNALCGVVRYPNSTTYNAGANPFCGCGCGCGAI